MITTMTQKRQVTIAKALCDEEGLAPGRPVRVERLPGGGVGVFPADGDRDVVDEKRKRFAAAVEKWAGKGLDKRPTEVIMRELRGDDLP